MHHTKIKGDIGVTKLIAFLYENNYTVSIPISEHLSYDLIAEDNKSNLIRIQVKYRTLSENDSIEIKLTSTGNRDSTGKIIVSNTDLTTFEYYGIYCPDIDKCMLLSTNTIVERGNSSSVKVRVTPSKNGSGRNYLQYNNETGFVEIVKSNFICPYCKINKKASGGFFKDWKAVRAHVSSCSTNNGQYYIDEILGPIYYTDLKNKDILDNIRATKKDLVKMFRTRDIELDLSTTSVKSG